VTAGTIRSLTVAALVNGSVIRHPGIVAEDCKRHKAGSASCRLYKLSQATGLGTFAKGWFFTDRAHKVHLVSRCGNHRPAMSRLSKNMPLPGPCIIFILSNQAKSSVDEHTSPNPFIQNVFHFEQENQNFNDLAKDINGFTYWSAREYMEMLGYESYEAFRKAINKAISTCTTLDIDVSENFQQTTIDIAGRPEKDFRLSRFACYLVAMNADPKKLQVAQAQAFFAATAETIRRYVDNAEDVERVLIREEVSTHEKALNSAAKTAGVSDQGFALFQNAGYRGMYNMNLSQLKKHKGLQQANRSLLDFMGKDELAANLFRLTQTELKLKNDQVRGQNNAERVAEDVGKKVRKTMLDISGTKPEDMELADDIKKVRTSLKQTHKGLNQIDG